MRLLFFVHQFYPEYRSGTEKVTLNLAKAAQRAGHHVCVLACTMNPSARQTWPSVALPGALESVHEGLPVVLLPRGQLPETADFSLDSDPAMVFRLSTWLKAQRFDIAHGMHPMRMASTLKALVEARIPYLLTLTDFFYECTRINLINLEGAQCDGPEEGARCAADCLAPPLTQKKFRERYEQGREFLERARLRIAPSDFVARRYREAFPGLAFRTLAHGVDIVRLAASIGAASPQARRPGAPLALTYIGTMVEQKGATTLLEGLARVPQANVRLRLAGGFYGNHPYEAQVRKWVDADSRASLIGELNPDEVPRELARSDVLCLPSLVPETFSLILHEAAAAGVPAMVSDIGAPADFVTQSGAGLTVKAGDAQAWSHAIATLADDPARLDAWRERLPLPLRQEEEAFFYQALYRSLGG